MALLHPAGKTADDTDMGMNARQSSGSELNTDADRAVREVRRRLGDGGPVLVLTGAGMSVESGIAPFRGGDHGLWSRFDPARLASPEGFAADPGLVWAWYLARMAAIRASQPHAGHRALAALAQTQPSLALVTQNVDDLHERAGSRDVIHLHGEIFALRCADCGAAAPAVQLPSADDEPALRLPPPRCTACGGGIRPGVVWFGEALPAQAWAAAQSLACRCALLLVVGTSGVVHPAAALPAIARDHGAFVVEINPEPTAISADAQLCWRATAAQALPQLLPGAD
jgi:NAD-dependent deacetylase